jgi:tRNA A-37 threonylcarbamoyl transferase component Bud32
MPESSGAPTIPEQRIGRERIVGAARIGLAIGVTRGLLAAWVGGEPLLQSVELGVSAALVTVSVAALVVARFVTIHHRVAVAGAAAALLYASVSAFGATAAVSGPGGAAWALGEAGMLAAIAVALPAVVAWSPWAVRATVAGVAIAPAAAFSLATPLGFPTAVAIAAIPIGVAGAALAAWITGRVRFEVDDDAPKLGGHALEEKLGEGAMGEVWRASHRRLSRPVAMKLMRPEMFDKLSAQDAERLRRRFEREAQATARLTSPYAVRLYDFGVEKDGSFYYAMELLDGVDLETLVRRFGRLPPERVAAILLQIGHALDDAHTQGLVHRDVKPANLFLCRQGRDVDVVKVLDFGLVALMGDVKLNTGGGKGPSGRTILTLENVVVGSPAYIAPERLLGTGGDHRADLYAVACVAYWLLTGRRVFSAFDVAGQVAAHVGEEPDPPSAYALVPPELDAIVMAGLAKDPSKRPQTAHELVAQVEQTGLATGWPKERAREWWDTHLPAKSTTRPSAGR